jgi:excinuclease ABC subunit C
VALLSYHSADLIAELKQRMAAHAERLEFERALKLRDQIRALEATLEKQIVERDVEYDQDVVYFGERHAMIARMDAGAMGAASMYDLDITISHAQSCRNFLLAHYSNGACLPAELIVNELDDAPAIAAALSQRCGRRVKITLPRRGAKRDLLRLCEQNYRYRIKEASNTHGPANHRPQL